MNLSLLRRFFSDGFGLLVLLTVASAGVELAFMSVLREFSDREQMIWMRSEFVQRMLRALLGAELTPDVSATGLMALGFTHPVIYALSWSYLLTAGTRVPANEIERGTADLLLSLPVTRATVYVSMSVSLLAAAVLLTSATLAGAWLANRWVPLWEPLDFGRLGIVATNLLAVQICVIAVTLLASTCCARRGPAIAWVLGWVFVSLLLEFFGQLSETAKTLGLIGLLRYYRPLPIVHTGAWPVGHLGVLLIAALGAWVVGLLRFGRRDIPAV